MLKGGYQIIDADEIDYDNGAVIKGIYNTILNCNKPILISGYKRSYGKISFFAFPYLSPQFNSIYLYTVYEADGGNEHLGLIITEDDKVEYFES